MGLGTGEERRAKPSAPKAPTATAKLRQKPCEARLGLRPCLLLLSGFGGVLKVGGRGGCF